MTGTTWKTGLTLMIGVKWMTTATRFLSGYFLKTILKYPIILGTLLD